MKMVEYHPLAFEELVDSAEYYEAQVDRPGESFLDEVERDVAVVSASPERWPYFLLNSRRHLLNRFPYSIVYLIETERIYILAVMHQRRRPAYWIKRLNRNHA
jgi:plasmid stabilization system protein ParE